MKKDYYKIKAENVIENLAKRNIKGYFVNNSEAAAAKVMEIIDSEATVSWGGSMTLKEIGIFELLKNSKHDLLDRADAKNKKEREEIFQKALSSDYYLMSSNAITQTGKLVNIDGNGNRLAALIYGPKNIIIVAGINKVTIDEESALKRVSNQAAPANAIRLNQNTPCAKTGYCSLCKIEDTICCQTVITRYSRQKNRIKVILVGEELGF